MAQRVPLQLNSAVAQSSLPKTQRGQSENTSQLQFKLVQKNGFAPAGNHSSLSTDRDGYTSNAVAMKSKDNVASIAQPSSFRNSAGATTAMANNPMSITIDDSMLLSLLKQIVDSEFSKSRNPVASADNSVQDSEIQIKRDAVFGVLRSALDVAQQSTHEQVEIQADTCALESTKLQASPDLAQAATSAPRVECDQPLSKLLQEASRLATVVKSLSPSSMTRNNFLVQTWVRQNEVHIRQIVWRLAQQFGKSVENKDRTTKDVCTAPVLVSIRENDYCTAPLWYQQDMENGPPQQAFSSTQRTWREYKTNKAIAMQ